jgi:ribosomal protein S18 acetylase RimI-like enzyme
VRTAVRFATTEDFPQVFALLRSYYEEWNVWQRDDEAAVRKAFGSAPLGYFLAEIDGQPAGCVQIKPLPALPDAVECKRLFVMPAFRGHRLAGTLMDAAESAARAAGYRWVYLDSADEFVTAIALYRRRGYEQTERYNDNAQATIFLRLALG